MNVFALLAAVLLALCAPASLLAQPAPADEAAAPATLDASDPEALPGETADAATGVLRLRIRNDGPEATVLLSVTDATAAPSVEVRTLRARADTVTDHRVQVGKVTTEVRNGLAAGMATRDLAKCPSRVVEQNYTVEASGTSWRIVVGQGWCVPRA